MFLVFYFFFVCFLSSFMLWCIFVQLSPSFQSELETDTNDEVVGYDESTNQTSKVNYRMLQLSKYDKHLPWLYYSITDKGYKCKIYEKFQSLLSKGGHSKSKLLSGTVN